MKNKGLIITSIILLFLCTLFLIIILIAGINGNMSFNGIFLNSGIKSNNIILEKNYDLEMITDIDITNDSGDITLEKTQDTVIKIVAYGQNENDIKVSVIDGTIKLVYTRANKNIFNFWNYRNDIIVYIPSNYSNNIKIKTDYGNCFITDLEYASIEINSDAGNVEVGKVNDVNINCDYGNIKVDTILNKCDIQADYGNIEIKKALIKENSNIKADMGNVIIKETSDIYIDSKIDLGHSNINNNNRNSNVTLKIICNLGNIYVN